LLHSTLKLLKHWLLWRQTILKFTFTNGTSKWDFTNGDLQMGIYKWDILRRAAPWNPITKFCRLCVEEKHQILFHPENATLNQRSEFFSKCFHKAKHLLAKS